MSSTSQKKTKNSMKKKASNHQKDVKPVEI